MSAGTGPSGTGPGRTAAPGALSVPRGEPERDMMSPMAVARSTRLVGRDGELDTLVTALGVGAAPRDPADSTHALVSGDAGTGKTRLLVELRDRALAQGWQVFAGHCLDFGDSALPFLPFSEVVGRLASELPDVVAEVTATHPALSRLQPGVRLQHAAPETAQPAPDRTELFESFHLLLEAAARQAPTLLVVEDLHWADESTRDLLGFLFSRPFAGQVSVVASYRSDDLHRRHPLRRQVAEWSRLREVTRLPLDPLSDVSVRDLVGVLADQPVPESHLSAIVARAEGNAFFVEELVASGPHGLPDDLADLLLVRLDHLPAGAREVVRAASVAGRRVTHDLLAAASGVPDSLPSADFEEAVRAAVERNVLVAGTGTYRFRHALLAEAVYDDLLPGERVRLHGAFVGALRSGGLGTAAELARHARLAVDLDTAVRASVEAGEEAYSVGGSAEAAGHFEQALRLLADPERRRRSGLDTAVVALHASNALSASGDPQRAAAVLRDQVEVLADDEVPDASRARLLSAWARALLLIDGDHDAVEVSRRALALVPLDSDDRAVVLGNHAAVMATEGEFDEARTAGAEAVAIAEKYGLLAVDADVTITLTGLDRDGSPDALQDAWLHAIDRAVASGSLNAELRARYLMGRSFEDRAEWEQARRWFTGAMEAGQARGRPWSPYALESRWRVAWVAYLRGEWDTVLELTAAAEDLRGGTMPEIPRAMLLTLRLAVPLGRGEEVGPRARRLRAFWAEEGFVAIHASALEIGAAALRRDPAAAVEAYDAAVAVLSRSWHEWFGARVRLAALAVQAVADSLGSPGSLGAAQQSARLDEVARLLEDGRTVPTHLPPHREWGPEGRAWSQRLEAEALRAAWLAGGADVGADQLVSSWRETEALFEHLGHEPELLVVRARLAAVLRATGDQSAAREVADAARATARRLGAVPVLDDLGDLAAPAARGAVRGAAPLTSREREVLRWVAAGRTNGEIGKHLFIATKTVSVHVSNILAKLGASSRTEAAAIARREGLVD
ncbi:MAG: AAA family ATPase [Nocardioides sp.]|uniref:helix-turn-helix transcriptional regulator n=1 Tax=Nocardioides sp. TaxID=35761 RepID=UPI003EFDC357